MICPALIINTSAMLAASAADRATIESLVHGILDAKSSEPPADVSCWEREIDEIVGRLYFGEETDEVQSHVESGAPSCQF